jgi:hypothetical protein
MLIFAGIDSRIEILDFIYYFKKIFVLKSVFGTEKNSKKKLALFEKKVIIIPSLPVPKKCGNRRHFS